MENANQLSDNKQKELENYIERYEKEREKVRKLQNELTLLKGENDKIPQYKALIDDFKIDTSKLGVQEINFKYSDFLPKSNLNFSSIFISSSFSSIFNPLAGFSSILSKVIL